ncbi:hypothetical protein AMJ80_05925 [bacterium SM23_31]|nr:MAG: hypothetical protein AMJ80_05925 [bacterium SM23_31]
MTILNETDNIPLWNIPKPRDAPIPLCGTSYKLEPAYSRKVYVPCQRPGTRWLGEITDLN